jgi:molecular chaperone GrpE (heat shock protein)
LNGESIEIKDQRQASITDEPESGKPETEKREEPLGGSQELVQPAGKELQDKVTALESQVEARAGVITGLEGQLATLSRDFEGAKAAYAYAVEDYKKLAASSNPLIPAEAIQGATIEEVKDSLDRALKLVANVQSALQEGLSKQAQAASIPAGAPARAGLDTSAMSTKEKINYGLEQARRKKD